MIKQEKDVFKRDLSKIEGSYAKELNDHIAEINSKFEDDSIDVNRYKEFVNSVVSHASDTPAKRNFVANLARKRTKYDVLFYVTNSLMNGSGLGVI